MNIKQLMQQMDYGPAPEATELAESWLARYADQGFGHFINGEFVYPSAAEYLPVINPARKQNHRQDQQSHERGCRSGSSRRTRSGAELG